MSVKAYVGIALVSGFVMTVKTGGSGPFDWHAYGFNTAVALVLTIAGHKAFDYVRKYLRL